MLPGIGVFGTGEVAKVFVPLLREKDFSIKAIWGKTISDAEKAAKDLNIPFFTNKIDDVLLRKDVDLVFIICLPYLHSEISVKALGIGKHVVCDKPMGICESDALKMVRASQYYPALISLVNHSLRFLPAITHMKRHIADGMIGQIELIDIRVHIGSLLRSKFDWMCDASMGGGILNLVGSHVIDLVKFLLNGKKATRAHGLIRTYKISNANVNGIRQISAPDYCTFQLEVEGNVLVSASLFGNTVASNTFFQEIMVCGRDGHLVVRGGDLFVMKIKDESLQREEAVYVDVQDLHFSTLDSTLPKPYIKGLCKMVGALKESFSQNENAWVKEPVQAAANFEDGLYVRSVIDAICKSNECRNWCKVEISPEYTPIS
ncbi:glucose-fructose oxidoreductase domain-containing protein 2 [Condylostylus longicornis]|uniref:glucose-fructose oxidoreductase domain-containing protein 2 n=1 Tax=Condylostylus longicornis TaxID=2530218 RepID=UPI00244E18CC|nr:glucose-fructose oxidoreductase domain-containing protein 2 [Condylostylus longicornis]